MNRRRGGAICGSGASAVVAVLLVVLVAGILGLTGAHRARAADVSFPVVVVIPDTTPTGESSTTTTIPGPTTTSTFPVIDVPPPGEPPAPDVVLPSPPSPDVLATLPIADTDARPPEDRGPVVADTVIVFEHCCFTPGEEVLLVMQSDPVTVGIGIADAVGFVRIAGRVPRHTPAGPHVFTLYAPASGTGVRTVIQVIAVFDDTTTTPVPSRGIGAYLPVTGSDSVRIVWAGGAIVLLGLVLVAVSRRRSRSHASTVGTGISDAPDGSDR
jgi:hypothetical protein